MVKQRINVVVFLKGEERYEFRYTDEQRLLVCRRMADFAANPELSFSWFDAALVSQQMRHLHRSPRTAAAD